MLIDQQPKLSLDKVKIKFQQWRDTRTNSREKIPESLWSEALLLIGSYPAYEITSALGLNHTQLKTKLNEAAQAELNKVGLSNPFVKNEAAQAELNKVGLSNPFVKVEVGNHLETALADSQPRLEKTLPLDHAGPVEIKRSDGSVLIIQTLPFNAIHSLIQAFIG
jgi:hypothetical protein